MQTTDGNIKKMFDHLLRNIHTFGFYALQLSILIMSLITLENKYNNSSW